MIITAPLYPAAGNNANLISRLIPFLSKTNEVRILSVADNAGDKSKLPDTVFGAKAYFADFSERNFRQRFVLPFKAKIVDKGGFSDYISSEIFKDKIKEIRKEFEFDAVISTCEPFPLALAASRLKGMKKFLYLMDPPEITYKTEFPKFRRKKFRELIINNDVILTTPFIKNALEKLDCNGNFATCGFPMVCDDSTVETKNKTDSEITDVLFCGWLYSGIRSPEYFLNIVSRLDEKYRITFMGRECDKLSERFEIKTKAEIITLPQQPYEKALEAMEKADILVNIGNSVPVHMPSKTLEYINTGKPFVNFYKMEDCPTLYYSERYPLCLNLYEGDGDIENAVKKFTSFCESKKGERVGRDYIVNEFADCTPEYAAKIILDGLVN